MAFTMLFCSIAGAQFAQQGSKLVAAGTIGKAWTGAVAVSADGCTAVVGGPGDNGATGAAWVFTRPNRTDSTLWVPVFESQAAWLPHLTENAAYRTNLGLVNTGAAAAEATIELHDGSGAVVASYAVALAPGEWKQETQPFRNRAGQAGVHCGYAKVIVTSGSGVVTLASVVDNITNDPNTIIMQR